MTKIDIFSGFLGAGKTTLIRKLIAEAYEGEKLVLIENEFGEIGIDGAFMQDAGIEVREMNAGCICCSLVGDFGEALKKVLDTYAPDRILIEPSGVGKLSEVMTAVNGIDNPDMKLNSCAAVVDARRAKVYMKNFGEFFNDQVQHAGTILLSRTQGMDEDKLNGCVMLLKDKNPQATVITTPWEALSGKAILAAMEKEDSLAVSLKELEESHPHHHDEDEECCCGHHHGHHHHDEDEECSCGHHHGHHHHDEDEECSCGHHHEHHHHHHGHDADEVFTSWGVETPRKYSHEELETILRALEQEALFGKVVRSKGVVDGKDGQWLFFDYVPEEGEIRNGQPQVTGRICVIGSGLKEEALKELFKI